MKEIIYEVIYFLLFPYIFLHHIRIVVFPLLLNALKEVQPFQNFYCIKGVIEGVVCFKRLNVMGLLTILLLDTG